MTIDERIAALLEIAQEHTKELQEHTKEAQERAKEAQERTKELQEHTKQIKEHTKQLETDGQHIKQLAMIVQEQNAEIQKMTNGINALVELAASHETRLNHIEGGQA